MNRERLPDALKKDLFKCILCSGREVACFVNRIRDDENRCAARCCSCGHIQIAPLPTIEEDILHYQKEEQHREKMIETDMSLTELMNRHETYAQSQVEWTERVIYPFAQAILEIGSGWGWFVEKMRERMTGGIVDGIELSDNRRKMAKKRSNIELLNINLMTEEVPESLVGKYEVLCMFHLLEHIHDPVLFLKRASVCLKNNGKLIIEVPNINDSFLAVCEEYKDFMYLRAHISYFSEKMLEKTLEKAGFQNIRVIGRQVFSIENALYWLRNKKPCITGQMLIEVPDYLEEVNNFYKNEREKTLTSDMLFAIAELR